MGQKNCYDRESNQAVMAMTDKEIKAFRSDVDRLCAFEQKPEEPSRPAASPVVSRARFEEVSPEGGTSFASTTTSIGSQHDGVRSRTVSGSTRAVPEHAPARRIPTISGKDAATELCMCGDYANVHLNLWINLCAAPYVSSPPPTLWATNWDDATNWMYEYEGRNNGVIRKHLCNNGTTRGPRLLIS